MQPTVIKCKNCGRLFKVYPHQVYYGDINYCPECNKKAENSEWVTDKSTNPNSKY